MKSYTHAAGRLSGSGKYVGDNVEDRVARLDPTTLRDLRLVGDVRPPPLPYCEACGVRHPEGQHIP